MKQLRAAAIILMFVSSFSFYLNPASGEEQKRLKPELGQECVCRLIALLEIILTDNDQIISVNNGRIAVISPAFKEIAKRGPGVLDDLIVIMECPRISFDTFVRCYSICNQVVRTNSRGRHNVYWMGGCKITDMPDGSRRMMPGSQMDVVKFRQKVVQDIKRNRQEILDAIREKKSKKEKEKSPVISTINRSKPTNATVSTAINLSKTTR